MVVECPSRNWRFLWYEIHLRLWVFFSRSCWNCLASVKTMVLLTYIRTSQVPSTCGFATTTTTRIDARSIRYALLALGFVVSHLHIAPFFRLFHVIYYTQITRLALVCFVYRRESILDSLINGLGNSFSLQRGEFPHQFAMNETRNRSSGLCGWKFPPFFNWKVVWK